jgi:AraC family transcriptional regulator of adaptative response/methylated-DNA-[protein]-cysteine methyltransferase
MAANRSLSRSQMLKATFERNADYDGIFFVGVRSTGIFCLPSCKARKPLEKHIIFFQNQNDAIEAGYRGCKRCRADQYPNLLPDWYSDVIKFLEQETNRKISEEELTEISGVNISTLRRYFKTHLKITPQEFHRKKRLQFAHKLIETGKDYLTVSRQLGYSSSSGFRSAFTKEFGYPPSKVSQRNNESKELRGL